MLSFIIFLQKIIKKVFLLKKLLKNCCCSTWQRIKKTHLLLLLFPKNIIIFLFANTICKNIYKNLSEKSFGLNLSRLKKI